jgi:hypothetical protein
MVHNLAKFDRIWLGRSSGMRSSIWSSSSVSRDHGTTVALHYADQSNLIGVPKSHHEGRLTGKGTIPKKVITSFPHVATDVHCVRVLG